LMILQGNLGVIWCSWLWKRMGVWNFIWSFVDGFFGNFGGGVSDLEWVLIILKYPMDVCRTEFLSWVVGIRFGDFGLLLIYLMMFDCFFDNSLLCWMTSKKKEAIVWKRRIVLFIVTYRKRSRE